MECRPSSQPIVVVAGATGTGKSRLAIELAQRFNGEVVNADSMQIYKGLEIATAKVSKEEREVAPHHLLDVLEAHQSITVIEYKSMAIAKIEEIHARNALPILVGGTNYYIQSVLWTKSTIEHPSPSIQSDEEIEDVEIGQGIVDSLSSLVDDLSTASRHKQNSDILHLLEKLSITISKTNPHLDSDLQTMDILHLIDTLSQRLVNSDRPAKESSHYLYNILSFLDPSMATLYHPSDFRRIFRSIQIYAESGRTQSEHSQQNEKENELRYPVVVLWVDTDRDVLYKRLDQRVDDMIQKGLLDEVSNLYTSLVDAGVELPFYHGTLQSIGYKEFRAYIEAKQTNASQTLLDDIVSFAVDATKRATRRYACRQLTWIRNRLIRPGIACLRLDSSNPDRWDENVLSKACTVVDAFTKSSGEYAADIKDMLVHAKDKQEWKKFYCEKCQKTVNGPNEWKVHLSSKSHRKRRQHPMREVSDRQIPVAFASDAGCTKESDS